MRMVKSAERTLALFELFSKRQRPLTVGRIADELKIPQASTSMLLGSLRELGYLTYNRQSRTYAPTIRVALLGSWINHQFDKAGSLTTRLQELQDTVDETVFVGIQNGVYAQYIFVMPRDKPRSMQVLTGQIRLLTASAVGQALLSQSFDQEVLRLVRRCNAEAPDARLRVVPGEFLQLVQQVRSCGYAHTRGDVTPKFGAFAVPVQAPTEIMRMAIGVGVSIDRIEEKRAHIIAALRALQANFEPFIAVEQTTEALSPRRSAA